MVTRNDSELTTKGSTMEFFGTYLEVMPPSRLVWTNDEGEEGSVTTATFEDRDGKTLVVVRDLYPSKEALTHSCFESILLRFR